MKFASLSLRKLISSLYYGQKTFEKEEISAEESRTSEKSGKEIGCEESAEKAYRPQKSEARGTEKACPEEVGTEEKVSSKEGGERQEVFTRRARS